MIGVDEDQYQTQNQAIKEDRFIACYDANPNNGMEEVRKIRRLKEAYDLKAVTAFPSVCPGAARRQSGTPFCRVY